MCLMTITLDQRIKDMLAMIKVDRSLQGESAQVRSIMQKSKIICILLIFQDN